MTDLETPARRADVEGLPGRVPRPVGPDTPRSRWRRRLLLAAGAIGALLALVAGGGYLWLSSASAVSHTGTDDCHQVPTSSTLAPEQEEAVRGGICATISGLSAAWAGQDAEAYGDGFTADATYTTFAGTYYSGRGDIVRSHAALFGDVLADTQLADSFLELRVLTSDVAVLTTRGDNFEGDAPGELTKVQTYTLVQNEEGWKVASFQNTQRKPIMEQIQYLWMPDTRPSEEPAEG